jgi:hypothetical protein
VRDLHEFDEFLAEVYRLLHNFLAAAMTLRDHTRRLRQQYPPADSSFSAEYDSRVRTTFVESPLSVFIEDLRNYTLHRSLPFVQGTLTRHLPTEAMTATAVLRKEPLQTWDRWRAGASSYLQEADGQIDLLEVVDSYSSAVDGFNIWFASVWRSWHAGAFQELHTLENELKTLLPD